MVVMVYPQYATESFPIIDRNLLIELFCLMHILMKVATQYSIYLLIANYNSAVQKNTYVSAEN